MNWKKSVLSLTLAGALFASVTQNVYAAYPTNAPTQLELDNVVIAREAANEGMVLLENKNQVLPIAKESSVALFGNGTYATIKGGTGSGEVNNRHSVSIYEGLREVYSVSNSSYWDTFMARYEEGKATNESNECITVIPSRFGPQYPSSYVGVEHSLTQEEIDEAKQNGTTIGIYTVSRISGEGADRSIDKGDYYLSDMERENIELVAKSFEQSIVILNVGGIIDTKFFDEIAELDGLFLMSQAGEEEGNAVADLFSGAVTPSGKLTDTWAVEYSDYPASATIAENDGDINNESYAEGVYVGYRYFDTFNITPAYEFGYGLSYTDFSMDVVEVKADAKTVSVQTKVTNTGSEYSGKEVVEVYFSAPEGNIEKPYQELAAYAKTDVLAPGESQIVTVSFDTADMASYYEERAAYVLEEGGYVLRVGNSSRNTKVAAVLNVSRDVITEQLSNQMGDDNGLQEYSNYGVVSYSYPGETEEIANAERLNLDFTDYRAENNASEYEDEKITSYVTQDRIENYETEENETMISVGNIDDAKLLDVYQGKYTMEDFVAQLSDSQLAHIVNGISGSVGNETIIGAAANTVIGGAGETTNFYYETNGIPNIVLADGPAGVRITDVYTDNEGNTYYQYCTAVPVGTALAQTWNEELVRRVGEAIGKEMNDFGVTLWLAPGMNIHRDPICGRNFEYYSEDPYLTGIIGAAMTKGVQMNPGIGVTIKHYIANNQEDNRSRVNNWMSERAIREIYLRGFEIAVKSAQPMAIMSSYNKVNGTYTSEDYDLLENITRGEWGFDGIVMTDWGAGNRSSVNGMMHSGNDLVMPGATQNRIIDALAGTPSNDLDTKLILGDVQKSAVRVLNIIMQSTQFANMYPDEVQAQPYSSKYTNLKQYNAFTKTAAAKEEVPAPSNPETPIVSYKNDIKVNAADTLYVNGNTGKTTTITVTKPAAAQIASITYTSSKPGVAQVDASGKVTAKKAGRTEITTTVNLTNGESAVLKKSVRVRKAYIELTRKKSVIRRGKAFTFRAKAYGTTRTVKWSVSNKRIAAIGKKGRLSAKRAGTVYVKATAGKITKRVKVRIK